MLWRKESLLPGYVESKTYLSEEAHAQLKILAGQTGMRMPFLMGLCIEEYLEWKHSGKVETPRIQLKDNTESIPSDLLRLITMIHASRFPKENGSTRLRYTSIILAILSELSAGARPTVRNIAHRTNSHDSQLNLMVKVLVDRGIITRTHMAGAAPSRSSKVLEIRPDAIANLERIHKEQIGTSLLGEIS